MRPMKRELPVPVRLVLVAAAAALCAAACARGPMVRPARPGFVQRTRPLPDTARVTVLARRGAFEQLAVRLAELPDDSSSAALTARGLLESYRGERATAESTLRRALARPGDSATRYLAYGGLQSILLEQERYAALESAALRARDEDLETADENRLVSGALNAAGFDGTAIDFPPSAAVLPLELTRFGQTVAMAAVNGAPPEEFHFDTGASMSVLTEGTARRCGVRRLEGQAGSTGTSTERQVSYRLGLVDSLRIAGLTVRMMPVMILPDSDLELALPTGETLRVNGIVGWPLMARLRLTLDYPARSMVIEPPRAAGRARNLAFFGMPMVDVAVDGSGPLHFILDTGAKNSCLLTAGLDRLVRVPKLEQRSVYRAGAGGGGTYNEQRIASASVTCAGQTVSRLSLPVRTLPDADMTVLADGILGSNVLSRFAVTLDAGSGTLELHIPKR
jgi:hypothetical protein